MKGSNEIPAWKGCGTTEEGSDFEVGGLRVWKHQWHSVSRSIYRIEGGGKVVEFRAEEVSMGVWSFWVRNVPG